MRQIIQIATDSQPSGPDWNAWTAITVLCDDGTVFEWDGVKWKRIPALPQH